MPVLTRKLLKHSETQSSNSKILIDIEIVPERLRKINFIIKGIKNLECIYLKVTCHLSSY